MLCILSENNFPSFNLLSMSGITSLANIAAFETRDSEWVLTKKSFLDEFLANMKETDFAAWFSNFDNSDPEKDIHDLTSFLTSIDSRLMVAGISESDRNLFTFGIATPFSIRNDLGVEVFLNKNLPQISDGNNYCIGLSIDKNAQVKKILTNSSSIKKIVIKNHYITSRMKTLLKVSDINIIGYSDSGNIFIKASLDGEDQMSEGTGLCVFVGSTGGNIVSKVLNPSELAILIDEICSNSIRAASSLRGDVVTFPTHLVKALNDFSVKNTSVFSADFNAVSGIRSFELTALAYEKILEKGQYSYEMLKSLLESNLTFSDKIGNVIVNDIKNVTNLLKFDLIRSNNYIGMGDLSSKKKGRFVAQDVVFAASDDKILISDSIRQAKMRIENAIREAKISTSIKRSVYQNNIGPVMENLSKARSNTAKARNNCLLTAAAAKVFLDQLKAIEDIEIRSWWNNSLIGNLGSFVSVHFDPISGKYQGEIDQQKLIDRYHAVSSHCEYKYEECDYWIIERSGSNRHDYFGRTSSDRTEEDWRYSGEEMFTTSKTILNNLKLSFKEVGPQTSRRQGYTSCGEFRVVVPERIQAPRPALSLKNLEKLRDAMIQVFNDHINMAKLTESAQAVMNRSLKNESDAAFELGKLEAILFSAQELDNFIENLEAENKLLVHSDDTSERVLSFSLEDDDEGVDVPEHVLNFLSVAMGVSDCDFRNEIVYMENGKESVSEFIKNKLTELRQAYPEANFINGTFVNIDESLSLSLQEELDKIGEKAVNLKETILSIAKRIPEKCFLVIGDSKYYLNSDDIKGSARNKITDIEASKEISYRAGSYNIKMLWKLSTKRTKEKELVFESSIKVIEFLEDHNREIKANDKFVINDKIFSFADLILLMYAARQVDEELGDYYLQRISLITGFRQVDILEYEAKTFSASLNKLKTRFEFNSATCLQLLIAISYHIDIEQVLNSLISKSTQLSSHSVPLSAMVVKQIEQIAYIG